MKVKLAIVVGLALVLALVLTGCARPELADVAEARDECHAFGGVFTSWRSPEFGYHWECDLSDPERSEQ